MGTVLTARIRCGNRAVHGSDTAYHYTVDQVRDCCRTGRTFTEQDERDMQRMEAEGDRAETIRDERAKQSFKELVEGRPTKTDLLKRLSHLLQTRSIPDSQRRWETAIRQYVTGDPTQYGLQTAIERLETFPERATRDVPNNPASAVKAEGLYKLSRDVRTWDGSFKTGDLFQVVYTKGTKNLYAKLVTFPPAGSVKKRPTLTYAKGMVFKLLAEELVPAEEAQELTRKTGWCVFGHFLTNPKSIARGMGDVCFSRYPHLAKNAGN